MHPRRADQCEADEAGRRRITLSDLEKCVPRPSARLHVFALWQPEAALPPLRAFRGRARLLTMHVTRVRGRAMERANHMQVVSPLKANPTSRPSARRGSSSAAFSFPF